MKALDYVVSQSTRLVRRWVKPVTGKGNKLLVLPRAALCFTFLFTPQHRDSNWSYKRHYMQDKLVAPSQTIFSSSPKTTGFEILSTEEALKRMKPNMDLIH